MVEIIGEGITFDDVLLIPQYSVILPKDVDLSTKLTKRISLKIPILSAAMDTVTEWELAAKLAELGGAGVIHKNMPIDDQASHVSKAKQNTTGLVGAAISVVDGLKRAQALINAGADFLVIDTAHGHSKRVVDLLKEVKKAFNYNVDVVAGNVATKKAAIDLILSGADAIKVGVGPGSICTTRIVAGVGVPQLTAIMDVFEVVKSHNIPLIADGGIKAGGDIVKALAAGANLVMLGNLLAGTKEAPGEIVEIKGKKYKYYRGMGSKAAMKKGSSDRYGQESQSKFVPEGVEAYVEYKGSLEDVIFELIGGIKSGFGYVGAKTIKELQEKAKFIKITSNSLRESHTHDILQK